MSKRILIVGLGSIGERHLRCFQQVGATVEGCDISPQLRERITKSYQVPCHEDFSNALKNRTWDGVLIATPANFHIPMALEAVRTGIPTFLEKPLSTSLEGTDELLRESQSRGVPIRVAYVHRSMWAVQEVAAFLRTGAIGDIRQVTMVTGSNFPKWRPAYRDIYYKDHATGGGAIQDALTHPVNYVEWMVGPTTRLYCDASHQVLPGVEVEDTVHVAARNGDVMVTYSLNQFQAQDEVFTFFAGTRGSVRMEHHNFRWGHFLASDEEWVWHSIEREERDASFKRQAKAFLKTIGGEETNLCTLEEGIQTLRFNLAALESMKSGNPVQL